MGNNSFQLWKSWILSSALFAKAIAPFAVKILASAIWDIAKPPPGFNGRVRKGITGVAK